MSSRGWVGVALVKIASLYLLVGLVLGSILVIAGLALFTLNVFRATARGE